MMVRDFQAIVGFEAKEQFVELTGRLPDMCLACGECPARLACNTRHPNQIVHKWEEDATR